MQIFTKFNRFFGFTPTESKVVLFLIITFVIGSGVKIYKSYFPQDLSKDFDYSEQEREFNQRSRRIDSLEATKRDEDPKSSRGKRSSSTSRPKTSKGVQPGIIINLNTASKKELMQLPGVGEAMAERILLYREDKGRFQTVEELRKVKGIGGKKFEKLRPMVKVE